MLHELCHVNLFNKHIVLELKGFDTIINKSGFKRMEMEFKHIKSKVPNP